MGNEILAAPSSWVAVMVSSVSVVRVLTSASGAGAPPSEDPLHILQQMVKVFYQGDLSTGQSLHGVAILPTLMICFAIPVVKSCGHSPFTLVLDIGTHTPSNMTPPEL